MISCSNCGAENADESVHCGQCGNELQKSTAKKTMLAFALSPEALQEAAAAAKAAKEARQDSGAQPAVTPATPEPDPEPAQTEAAAATGLDPFAQTMMLGQEDAAKLSATRDPASESAASAARDDTPDHVPKPNVAQSEGSQPPADTAPKEQFVKYVSQPSGSPPTMSHLTPVDDLEDNDGKMDLVLKSLGAFGVLVLVLGFIYFILNG